MTQANPYQNNQDLEVLSASPLELVVLLYRGAIEALDAAKRHLGAGEIKERSKKITKICSILEELSSSLDPAQAPQLARQLAELYGYMHRRLCQANIEQTVEPLDEVRALLANLLDGWQQVCNAQADGFALVAGQSECAQYVA